MKAQDIMTAGPAYCTADTKLQEVAKTMVEEDCGAIPVVDGAGGRPIGIVTDRDIVTRAIARGINPIDLPVSDVMTGPPICVPLDASVDECVKLLGTEQVRRLIVVDQNGRCAGIIAQADVAKNASKRETGKLVQEVSEPVAVR